MKKKTFLFILRLILRHDIRQESLWMGTGMAIVVENFTVIYFNMFLRYIWARFNLPLRPLSVLLHIKRLFTC